MKSLTARREKIKELINTGRFSAQEDIIKALEAAGFGVTQPTLSRDLKEMSVIREHSRTGVFYAFPKVSDGYKSVFMSSIKSLKCAANIVVISCETGTAQAVCTLIDKLSLVHIVGTIAGDDTIFAACSSDNAARLAADEIRRYAEL
jgi:transcriptional regulator of arginine metabolism